MKNVKELAVMIFTASFLTLSLTACFGGGASKNSDITRVVLSGGGMRDIIYKAQAADCRPAQIIQKYRFRYSYRYSYRSTGEMV